VPRRGIRFARPRGATCRAGRESDLRRDFIYSTMSVGPAQLRRAVEVTGCVQDQVAVEGIAAVGKAREGVGCGLRPAAARYGRQLEDDATVGSAAFLGSAVEITGGIRDEARQGKRSIRTAETIHVSFFPASAGTRREFEGYTATVGSGTLAEISSILRCPVEIPRGVEDQAAIGMIAVFLIRELVERDFSPSTAGNWRQFKDQAGAAVGVGARGAALVSCAIKITGGVEDEIPVGIGPATRRPLAIES